MPTPPKYLNKLAREEWKRAGKILMSHSGMVEIPRL